MYVALFFTAVIFVLFPGVLLGGAMFIAGIHELSPLLIIGGPVISFLSLWVTAWFCQWCQTKHYRG